MLAQREHRKREFYSMNSSSDHTRHSDRIRHSSRPKDRLGPAVWIAGGILAASVLWLLAALFHLA